MAERCPDGHLSRRAFLRLGALAGGGLALAIGLPAVAATPTPDAPDAPDTKSPEVDCSPNAWIHLHGDGRIRLILARTETGQGVMTALPMLVAEELEVGLDQLLVELAPADPAFVNRLLGEQVTAEATSVRDAWTTLREAGATLRLLLVRAAAESWGVPESDCRAQRGRVLSADGSRSLGYGELAAAAARLPLPAQVPLKASPAWTLIGTQQRRLDTPDKVTGRACFGLDVRLPGMLFASVERGDLLGGRIRGWQSAAARRVPGVVDVVALESGVAVVAETSWAALRGRRALAVECRSDLGRAGDSERLGARFRAALGGRAAVAEREGDVSAMLDAAAHQLESVYAVSFAAHACMEPMNCTADVTPTRCVIHVPTQAQQGVLETARRITRLPAERIAVHTTFAGGAYGRRREQDFVAEAVELSRRLRRPVQVFWTREDDLTHDYYRPMTLHRLRGGLDAEGRVSAWYQRIVGPSILARVQPSAMKDGIDRLLVQGAVASPYDLPCRRVEYRRADIAVPTGWWHGGGYVHNVFAGECFLDELAALAAADPLDFRRRLLAAQPRHLRLLDLLAEQSGWNQPPAAGLARGVACVTAFDSLLALVAEVALDGAEVRVRRLVCALDCGQVVNPGNAQAVVEADLAFGLSAALGGAVTIEQGRIRQRGFAALPLLRANEMPEVVIHLVGGDVAPGGLSGLGVAPVAPAIANALHALTGQRVRSLPIRVGEVAPGASGGAG